MSKTHIGLTEYREGRNFIRIGDTVKCKPISGNRFRATVWAIRAEEDGTVVEVTVIRQGDHGGFRTFRPEKISRVAQSRVEVRA